jgi:hypothetical protein
MNGWRAILLLSVWPFLRRGLWAEESAPSLLATTTSQEDLTLVDPEFSQTPLPKLVLPPEPPANVLLPEVVVKSDEWKGSQCAVQEPRFAVFRHADKWTSFWTKALAPVSSRLAKVPPINFDKDMVVGVFMGEKPSPHYEIEIRSIRMESRPDAGQVLVVRYREVKRMMGVFVPPFAVQPFHLKRVTAYPGQVVFFKVRR